MVICSPPVFLNRRSEVRILSGTPILSVGEAGRQKMRQLQRPCRDSLMLFAYLRIFPAG
jgi:hypothetical protein